MSDIESTSSLSAQLTILRKRIMFCSICALDTCQQRINIYEAVVGKGLSFPKSILIKVFNLPLLFSVNSGMLGIFMFFLEIFLYGF